MSRTIIIISALILLPIAGFLVFSFFTSSDDSVTAPSGEAGAVTDLPGVENGNSGQLLEQPVLGSIGPGKMVVTGNDGLSYELKGSFGQNDMTLLEDNFYQLFKSTDPNSEWFDIFYDEPSGNVMILLYKEPLREARDRATQVLQERFNATPQLLCNLNINVFTNEYINPEYTGYNLGLSFCPNGVVLP
jgi:hypothetical protein